MGQLWGNRSDTQAHTHGCYPPPPPPPSQTSPTYEGGLNKLDRKVYNSTKNC